MTSRFDNHLEILRQNSPEIINTVLLKFLGTDLCTVTRCIKTAIHFSYNETECTFCIEGKITLSVNPHVFSFSSRSIEIVNEYPRTELSIEKEI